MGAAEVPYMGAAGVPATGCCSETGPVVAVIAGTGPGFPMTGIWAGAALAPTNTMTTEASNPLLIGLPFNS